MPSSAQWDQFKVRLAFVLQELRASFEMLDRYSKEREQVVETDPNGNNGGSGVGDLTVDGAKIGADDGNTDAQGRLYVHITASGDPETVSVYKATGGGGGDLVAQGSGNAGTVVSCSAQNSSGLSVEFPLDASPTAESSDEHILQVFLDARLHARRTFDGEDNVDEDAHSLDVAFAFARQVRRLASSRVAACVTLLQRLMLSQGAGNPQAYGREFIESSATSLIDEQLEVAEDSGEVTRLLRGFLEELRTAMSDDSESVVERVVAGAAGSANANNDGAGAIASHTPLGYMPIGTVTLECINGLGNGRGGEEEEFELRFASAAGEPDESFTFAAPLRIKQSYVGEFGFGGTSGITVTRTRDKDGTDGSHADLSDPTDGSWSETGESELNTDQGKLYWKIDANGSNWDISFYKSTLRNDASLVAKATDVATGAAFQATTRKGSGLTINGTVGSGPTDTNTGTLNLAFHTVRRAADGRPDSYTIAITETSSGIWSRLLSRLPQLRARLNTVSSGSETFEEGLAKANTFVDFAVEDN